MNQPVQADLLDAVHQRRPLLEQVSINLHSPRYAERRNNMVMANRMAAYSSSLGRELEPSSAVNLAGSSDIGNVSAKLPVIRPYVQICKRGTPSHSVPMREAARSPKAHDTVETTAAALAALVLDLLSDPAFLAEVQQEFASPSSPCEA